MKKSEVNALFGLLGLLVKALVFLIVGVFKVIAWIVDLVMSKLTSNDTYYELTREPPYTTLESTSSDEVEPWTPTRSAPTRGYTDPMDSDDFFSEFDLDALGPHIVTQHRTIPFQKLPASETGESCWVPPGRSVKIKGYLIRDGMVYVGKGLRMICSEWDIEPALIDPTLPIDVSACDITGALMDYWPAYGEIPEVARATYLFWLANGKKDPNIDIGYVFLYFYGLERRLLAERPDPVERNQLVAEVKRLLSLYGSKSSFRNYAGRLLSLLQIRESDQRFYLQEPELDPDRAKTSLTNLVGLAQLIHDQKPIPVSWAFAWTYLSDLCYFRTPAQRLPDLFFQLFKQKYTELYGDGMKVRRNKSRLDVNYHTANRSLHGISIELGEELPDPLALKRQPRLLQNLIEACQDELDPLSRWLGRNPGEESSIRAFALIPDTLVESIAHPMADQWRDWLQETTPTVMIPKEELIERWPFPDPAKPGKRETVELTSFLEKIGYGMEPDPRFHGPPLHKTEGVVLFALGQDTLKTPTGEYRSATLLLHLAAMVAWADDEVTEKEERHIETQIEDYLFLSEGERRRLRAHLQWLLQTRPSIAGLASRIEGMSTDAREQIGDFVIGIASVDGQVDPSEIKTLEKLFKMLNLDPELVITHLHQVATRTYGKAEKPPKQGGPLQLDPETIEAKRRESQKVCQLLDGIFQEEPESHLPEQPASTIQGLDLAHATLLQWLAEESVRLRDDVDAYCADLGIFPDGALSLLNEFAYDHSGEPLYEDNGASIEIIKETYEELIA